MAYQFDPNDETTNVSNHIILVENETICKRIGDLGMKMLQIMAYEGISEEKELILAVSDVILLSTGQLVSNDSIRRSIQTLSFNLLIEIEEVNTGIRRFNVLKLTENGRKFMGHNFRRKRVESECERFKREHANIHHGYLIKEVKRFWKIKRSMMKYQPDGMKISSGSVTGEPVSQMLSAKVEISAFSMRWNAVRISSWTLMRNATSFLC